LAGVLYDITRSQAQYEAEEVQRDDVALLTLASSQPVSLILDWLLVGNRWDAINREALDALNIKSIINITRAIPNAFPNDVRYLNIQINDKSWEDLFMRLQVTRLLIQLIFLIRDESEEAY
jgi:hypothetical protein